VTGYADQVSEGLALDAGFDHFLAKPADPFRIQELIEANAERTGQAGAGVQRKHLLGE
jgi:ActR/RegA family two-component response regulator